MKLDAELTNFGEHIGGDDLLQGFLFIPLDALGI